jgi:hypothetical protein
VRDLALRSALEGMLERYMSHWMKEAKRVKLFANVPAGIHVEPYIGWPHGAQTVEFGLRGSNDAGRAYLVAVNLQKAGLLERLRRCAHCTQWLIAHHPSRDRFCSNACREQSHREDRKTSQGAKRAAYMREYRKTTQHMAGVRLRPGHKHGLPVSTKLKNYERILRCSSSAIDCARMGDL